MQYNNDPYEILERRGIDVTEEIKQRIRGSEAAMWSEQVRQFYSFQLTKYI